MTKKGAKGSKAVSTAGKSAAGKFSKTGYDQSSMNDGTDFDIESDFRGGNLSSNLSSHNRS